MIGLSVAQNQVYVNTSHIARLITFENQKDFRLNFQAQDKLFEFFS